jgi:hypothetical protein
VNPKELIKQSVSKTTSALVSIESPLDAEVRDLEDNISLYTHYPFVPFFERGDATLLFFEKMRKLSPTNSAIISDLTELVAGGGLTVEKQKIGGFAAIYNEEDVTEEEWKEYAEWVDATLGGEDLLAGIKRSYDGFKTWGNAFVEVVMTTVAGQKVAKIHVHDADRCRYVITKRNEPKLIGISPIWTYTYLSMHPPKIVPAYPNIGQMEDGSLRTIIHIKNPTVGREWYGEPDSIGAVYFKYLEYQLGSYSTEGYHNKWIAKVFFETFGDPEDGDVGAFDRAIRDTFTQSGSNRKTVMHRNAPQDAKETRIHEFAPQTDEDFHAKMADIAETQILKAHNWNHLLLGVRISGSLGGGGEYEQVYREKYISKIRPEQEFMMDSYRKAINLVENWVGYNNEKKLTLGLRDLYFQAKMQENEADNNNAQ